MADRITQWIAGVCLGTVTLSIPALFVWPVCDYYLRGSEFDLLRTASLLYIGWVISIVGGLALTFVRHAFDPQNRWQGWPRAKLSWHSVGVATMDAFATFSVLPFLLIGLAFKAAFFLVLSPFWIVSLFSRGKPTLRGGEKADWTPNDELGAEAIKLRAWMKRLAEPAFLMIDAETPGFSKLGGIPDLPSGFDWPRSADGPLQFLLQLDFEEMRYGRAKPSQWLPTRGRLLAFFVPGGADQKRGVQLIFADPDQRFHPTYAPEGVKIYPETPVGFHRFKAAPSAEWLGPEAWAMQMASGDEDLQEEAGGYVRPMFGTIQHYVGGYPQEIQWARLPIEAELSDRDVDQLWPVHQPYGEEVDADVEAASKDWRMLLQIDSDCHLGWDWVSGGQLYVLIRREDAKRRDFSRTVTICQFT